MENSNLPKLLKPKEVGEYLQIGSHTLYALMRQKSFPSFKLGSRFYVREDKLIEWMDMKEQKLFTK